MLTFKSFAYNFGFFIFMNAVYFPNSLEFLVSFLIQFFINSRNQLHSILYAFSFYSDRIAS